MLAVLEVYQNGSCTESRTACDGSTAMSVAVSTGCAVSPLAISVLDIQPDDIIRHVMLVKACIDGSHICLIPVVPPALVVPGSKVLRQGRCPGQPGILR